MVPGFLWTRTVRGQRTRGRQLAAREVGRVRGELAAYQEFASLAELWIVEVNEAILARPGFGMGFYTGRAFRHGGRKKGLCDDLAREKAAEIGQLRRPRPWAAAMPGCRRRRRCSAPGC